MRRLLLLAALALFAVPPAASAQGFSPSHRRAAEELLNAMDLQTVLAGSIDAMLQVQIRQNPALADFEDVMRDFCTRYMGPESLGPRLVELYAGAFTEVELSEMAAFYRTPTGRRAIALMPALMGQGAEIGRQVLVEHQDELEALIAERARKLERERSNGGAP